MRALWEPDEILMRALWEPDESPTRALLEPHLKKTVRLKLLVSLFGDCPRTSRCKWSGCTHACQTLHKRKKTLDVFINERTIVGANELINEKTNGMIEEIINERLDGRINERIHEILDEIINERTHGQINEIIDECLNEGMHVRTI